MLTLSLSGGRDELEEETARVDFLVQDYENEPFTWRPGFTVSFSLSPSPSLSLSNSLSSCGCLHPTPYTLRHAPNILHPKHKWCDLGCRRW